jgi:hypothetical protein
MGWQSAKAGEATSKGRNNAVLDAKIAREPAMRPLTSRARPIISCITELSFPAPPRLFDGTGIHRQAIHTRVMVFTFEPRNQRQIVTFTSCFTIWRELLISCITPNGIRAI